MSLEHLIPWGEQLLVKRDPQELRCGEILIPGTAHQGITTSGVIHRVGPAAEGLFEPGQRVLFGILSGTALAAEGATSEEEYRCLPAGEVLCTIPARPALPVVSPEAIAALKAMVNAPPLRPAGKRCAIIDGEMVEFS